jgi:hypothetical protein
VSRHRAMQVEKQEWFFLGFSRRGMRQTGACRISWGSPAGPGTRWWYGRTILNRRSGGAPSAGETHHERPAGGRAVGDDPEASLQKVPQDEIFGLPASRPSRGIVCGSGCFRQPPFRLICPVRGGVMSTGRSSSLPLWKTALARTKATKCGALTARQRACAASISL